MQHHTTHLNWEIYWEMNPSLTIQPMEDKRRYSYRDTIIESQGGWWWVDGSRFGGLDDAMQFIDKEIAFNTAIRNKIDSFLTLQEKTKCNYSFQATSWE